MGPTLGIELATVTSVALCLVAAGLSAVVVGASRVRRVASLMLAMTAFLAGLTAPVEALVARGMIATFGCLVLFKWADAVRARPGLPLCKRMWDVVVPFDVTAAHRIRPTFDRIAVGGFAAFGALALLGAYLAMSVAPQWEQGSQAYWLVRWGGGVLFVYAMTDAVHAVLRAVHAALGFSIPPLQNHPVLSRSATEFWAQRWNLPVHRWLSRHVFRPLARRGHPRIGALFAFVLSAALHTWIVFVALGWPMALVMGAFFVVQGTVVLFEHALRLRRLRPALGHAWALIALVVPAPLFVEPFLQVFERSM